MLNLSNLFNYLMGVTMTMILVLLLHRLFRSHLSPKWNLFLYAVLAVRLLCPVLPSADISLMNFLPLAAESPVTAVSGPGTIQGENSAGIQTMPEQQSTQLSYGAFRQNISYSNNVPYFILLIWLFGAMLLFGYYIIGHLLFLRQVKYCEKIYDSKTIHILHRVKDQLSVKRDVTLRNFKKGPMLIGLLHPEILLPRQYTEEELELIFLHELNHLKFGDILFHMIAVFLRCLLWFHPLSPFVFRAFKEDMELVCDERTLSAIGNKQSYALLLLKEAITSKNYAFTTAMGSNKKELQNRIRFIATFQKPKTWLITLAAILILLLTVFCLTSSSRESLSPADALAQLKESVTYQNGVLHFTIPELYEKPEDWNILVAGRIDSGDGFGISSHWFENENMNKNWIKGFTYSAEVREESLTDLVISLSLPDENGDILQEELTLKDLLGEIKTNSKEQKNISFGEIAIPNTNLTLRLMLTEGVLIKNTDPEYSPGGGPGGMMYESNYIGSYELQTVKDSNILDSLPVTFEEGAVTTLTYPGNLVEFYLEDYNEDGNLEFTLGEGGFTGNNRPFNLYSITADGKISVLMEDVESNDLSDSPHLTKTTDGFEVAQYDNISGETKVQFYPWTNETLIPVSK